MTDFFRKTQRLIWFALLINQMGCSLLQGQVVSSNPGPHPRLTLKSYPSEKCSFWCEDESKTPLAFFTAFYWNISQVKCLLQGLCLSSCSQMMHSHQKHFTAWGSPGTLVW